MLLRSSRNGQLTATNVQQQSATASPGEAGLTWRRLIGDGGDQPGEGERKYQLIKYETPEYKGFTATAAWGEDDFWDVGLRYSGELSGFKIAAGVGYGEQRDGYYLDTKTVCSGRADGSPSTDQQCDQFGGSISIIHEATGLFVNAGAGTKVDRLLEDQARFQNTGVDDRQNFWAVQSGIEKKFNEFGKTTVYGEYYDYDGGGNSRRRLATTDALLTGLLPGGNADLWSSGVQMYGFGVAQGFDKAALTLYLSYRHVEADLQYRHVVGTTASGAIVDVPVEDLDLVIAGGIIKF